MGDSEILGELTVSEAKTLADLQTRWDAVMRSIGELELQRVRLVQTALEIEAKSAAVANGVAVRIGVPAGTNWAVGRDGLVRVGQP